MKSLFLILCVFCYSCSDSNVNGGLAKISVLVDGVFDDESFNEGAWKAVKKIEKEFGLEISMKESNANSYLSDLKLLKDNGSNLICLIGYKLSDSAITVALENPGIKYVIVDPVYDSDLVIPENLSAITFRSEEGAFLVGYIAAKISKTGKIGFLGGVDDVIINTFRYGYEAGAMYANSDINIDNKYIGSFVNTDAGESMANEMYLDGVDIIYHVAGLSGVGVIEAARNLGDKYYVIGVDQDQSYLAPDNVITSSIKDIGQILNIVISDYLKANTFEGGEVLNYGLREGFLGFVKNPKKISFALEKELDDISEKIINGKIVVPNNWSSYNKFLSTIR
ncbi:BMP family protein [Borrelia coriaceae]|uniref:BMP family ABC transporter substrate-binding protein n=1 Tax=Borrelia coriaceae TaxID=144 RepID=UPI00046CB6EA|nr:BMP family protein [Borrelia coriaceae]